jgi:hypothetical protein
MRIVTRGAGQFAVALQKALGFAKAIGRANELELVCSFVVRALSWRVVEGEDEVTQRFAGLVGECAAFIPL